MRELDLLCALSCGNVASNLSSCPRIPYEKTARSALRLPSPVALWTLASTGHDLSCFLWGCADEAAIGMDVEDDEASASAQAGPSSVARGSAVKKPRTRTRTVGKRTRAAKGAHPAILHPLLSAQRGLHIAGSVS